MRVGMLMAAVAALAVMPSSTTGQEGVQEDVREARIWLDRGDEPVVQRGERLRMYYRTSHDAYVAVFHIDTDGSVRLVHPTAPDEEHYVVGGRDYRLLFPRSPYWVVDEDPGIGYYFLLASPEPFDFSSFEYGRYEHGWDLSRVGRAVYEDPYVAMDDYVAALIPDWEYIPYALDFISYNVGGTHEYPRFMCYECHGFRSYATWNPYQYSCTDFRVVIWDDPYFYPVYRYRGTRVVYPIPLRNRPRFGFTTRVVGQPWAPVVRQRAAPPSRVAEYKEEPATRPSRSAPTQRRATPTSPTEASRAPARASVPDRSALQRRPSNTSAPGGVSRGGASGTLTRTSPSATGSQPRPVLQRRPSGAVEPRSLGSASRGSDSRGSGVATPRSGATTSPTGSRPSTARPPGVRSSPATRSSGSRPSGARAPAVVRPPATRSSPAARPQSRPSTTRSSPAARPPSRPSTTQSRPTVRTPARAPTSRPTVRPRGGGSSRGQAKPPVRRRGGGGST